MGIPKQQALDRWFNALPNVPPQHTASQYQQRYSSDMLCSDFAFIGVRGTNIALRSVYS